jgi:hypothetical protein
VSTTETVACAEWRGGVGIMSNSEGFRPEDVGGVAPSVEVRVYRAGHLIERVLCEPGAEAAAVVDRWAEYEDVECVVEDVSGTHTPEDILAPEADVATLEEDAYPAGDDDESRSRYD